MKKIRLAAACMLLLSAMVLQGCSGNDHGLDPDKPITLTLWHYYSGSQKQAFDELVDEFNETQGKKQGISVDDVAKGSISNISADLKSSLEKKVNAPELPNIFAAYGDTAEDMEKAEKLVSINDYMSDEEMAEYVDECSTKKWLSQIAVCMTMRMSISSQSPRQQRSWLSIRTYGMNLRKRKM